MCPLGRVLSLMEKRTEKCQGPKTNGRSLGHSHCLRLSTPPYWDRGLGPGCLTGMRKGLWTCVHVPEDLHWSLNLDSRVCCGLLCLSVSSMVESQVTLMASVFQLKGKDEDCN